VSGSGIPGVGVAPGRDLITAFFGSGIPGVGVPFGFGSSTLAEPPDVGFVGAELETFEVSGVGLLA
jgi:hypothetical protein